MSPSTFYLSLITSLIQYNKQFKTKMENDISLEQVKRDTNIREEKLQKMKNNIEALQHNMAKKRLMGKSSTQNRPVQIQPITIEDQPSFESKPKSPAYQNLETEFGYNSTLFRNINNDSQPILNNGSAVSNFSSVSNINNLLNNHLHRDEQSHRESPHKGKDTLMQDIDKILQKVQKTHKLPTRTLQKIIDQRDLRQSGPIPEEPLESSKSFSNRGQLSARTKLEEYKLLLNKLDPIEEEHQTRQKRKGYRGETGKEEKGLIQTYNNQEFDTDLQSYRGHKKDPSNLTAKSEYPFSEFNSRPPTPPNKKVPLNAVERQKVLIKESVQQYKKLQTESSHEMLDRSEIDFQLSDDEQHKKEIEDIKDKKEEHTIGLSRQKQTLEEQLKSIEEELRLLQQDC